VHEGTIVVIDNSFSYSYGMLALYTRYTVGQGGTWWPMDMSSEMRHGTAYRTTTMEAETLRMSATEDGHCVLPVLLIRNRIVDEVPKICESLFLLLPLSNLKRNLWKQTSASRPLNPAYSPFPMETKPSLLSPHLVPLSCLAFQDASQVSAFKEISSP